MSQRSVVAVFCCLGALVLPGCNFRASPADALQFQPPSGWRSSSGILGFMQFWRPPLGTHEALMLFKSPKQLSPNDVYSSANVQGAFKGVTVQHKRSIEICGHQPASLVQGIAISRDGTESSLDMVLSDVRGTSYMALYLRPIDKPPNPMAMAALRELCAKS